MTDITVHADSGQRPIFRKKLYLNQSQTKLLFRMPGNGQKHKDGYTKRNRVRLVTGGADYFILLEKMIENARHSVQLQTYIF